MRRISDHSTISEFTGFLAETAHVATTVKYYTHILPEALRSAQARLPFESVIADVSDTYHRSQNGIRGKKARIVKLFSDAR